MKHLLFALCAAFALVSCGGGGDSGASPELLAAQVLSAKVPVPDPTLAAQPVAVVNTTAAGDQVFRSIGALADGGHTVAWISDNTAIFMQRYDSAGNKVGGEVSVPVTIPSDEPARAATALREATLAVLGDGSVVVAYQIDRLVGQVGAYLQYNQGVYIQRVDASGTQRLGETEVFSRLALANSRPLFLRDVKIEALADGGFVLGWLSVAPALTTSPNAILYKRRYDSQAQPAGDMVTVGLFGIQNGAPGTGFSLAADASGGYTLAVSYADTSTDFVTMTSAIHYDALDSGTQLVAPRTGSVLLLPLDAGGFVLFTSEGAGFSSRVLDTAGNPVGDPLPLSSMPFDARELMDGSYLVFWNTGGTITAQRFDGTGAAIGDLLSLQASAATMGVAPLAGGGFATAWSAPGTGGDLDVFTQRFTEVLTQSQAQLRFKRKACLASAKGMTGHERQAFMDACMK